MSTFAALKITKAKPEEIEIGGLELRICNLALEGEKSQLYATVKTEIEEGEFEEQKALICTLTPENPQYACEIPIYGDVVKFEVVGNGTVYMIWNFVLDDEEFDEDMIDEENGEFEDFEDEDDEDELEKEEMKKILEQEKEAKKPKMKEEKKPVEKKEVKKEEVKKEEKKPVENKKQENNKKKQNKKNKNKNKK